MTEEDNNQETQIISGQQFEEPLYVNGGITKEPERYLAEKPYELSKFEFSILKKGKLKSDTWFKLVSGATAGFVLSILGKALNSLIQRQIPSLESWELWAVIAGIIAAAILKKTKRKTEDEKEFEAVRDYIDHYFKTTPRRRIHVARRSEDQK